MRVLLVNRFWGDPRVPSGRMLLDVARALSGEGHELVVLTSRDGYVDGTAEPDDHGAEVVRVRTWGPRAVRWALFWAAAVTRPLFMRWDRCLLLTDPPFMNWLALPDRLLRGRRRRRYWWVMDLYPEAACAAGILRPGGVADRLLRKINGWSLRVLDGVIALDEPQRRRLSTLPGARATDRWLVVPPWDRRRLPRRAAGPNRFRETMGLGDRRIVLYAGNLGRAHVYRPLVEAAREVCLAGRTDWAFVFVCRGHKRPALELEAEALPNVRVLDYVPADAAADLLQAADVHVITLDEAWTGISVPSKLYGVLPTGRPVLFLGSEDSGTAREILRRNAGCVLSSKVPPARVVDALRDLLARPSSAPGEDESAGAEAVARFVTS